MIKTFFKLKPSIPTSNSGFTLIELVVSAVVSLVVLSVSLSVINEQRRLFLGDQARSEANQNLRTPMDLIGTDVRLAGERLTAGTDLPVVSLTDGSSGAPDTLVMQRKLITSTLSVCEPVNGSDNTITVAEDADPDNSLDCSFSDAGPDTDGDADTADPDSLTDPLNDFQAYRCNEDNVTTCDRSGSRPSTVAACNADGECTLAFIHNPTTNQGEFFLYTDEDCIDDDGGTDDCADQIAGNDNALIKNRIHAIPWEGSSVGSWRYSYDTSSTIYILEERKYALNGDILELTEDREDERFVPETPKRITNQISDFQVQIRTSSGWLDTFNPNLVSTTGWQNLERIRISLDVENPSESDLIDLPANQRNLVAEFFPRNVLSED